MLTTFAKHYLYPSLLAWISLCVTYALLNPEHLAYVLAVKGGVTVSILFLFEWLTPLKPEWGMTKRHLFRRDLPMIVINSASLLLVNYGLLALSIGVASSGDGPASSLPLPLQVVLGLIAFEVLQYGVHRLMHRERGFLADFLWRSHAIHHLPQQLYLVMHAVFHPVNMIFVRLIVQLTPIWVFGFDPIAIFIYGSIIALQGTVSHLNVDMRLGVLNYLFIGPELHRYHHSSSTAKAVNFGAAISLMDLLFGSFHYNPAQQPGELGLKDSDGYPGQHAPIDAILFPFKKRQPLSEQGQVTV